MKQKIAAAVVVAGLIVVPGIVIAQRNNQAAEVTTKTNPSNSTAGSVDSGTTSTVGAITSDDAATIARQRFPGKTVEKIETENENSGKVYSVRFTDDSRIDVRASDGAIVRSEDRAND